MAKTKFIYDGPPSGFTLKGVDSKGAAVYTDVCLFPGNEVELDSEIPHVKSLVARGHLTEVTDKTPKTSPPKPDKPPKNTPNQSATGATATPTEVANG